jgi:hypothetical protein
MWTITRKYGVTNHLPFPLRAPTHGHGTTDIATIKTFIGKLYISGSETASANQDIWRR